MDLEAISWSAQILSRLPPPPFVEALFGSPSLVLASQDASKLSQSSSSLWAPSSACNVHFTVMGDDAFAKPQGQKHDKSSSACARVEIRIS